MNTFSAVLQLLGFTSSRGWVRSDHFDKLLGPVGALRRARDLMGVRGAFGTWQPVSRKSNQQRFIPLLYVAQAADRDAARSLVHRRVWSQGLVPFLIICTPESVFISEGYNFSQENWETTIVQIDMHSIEALAPEELATLGRFHAKRLLSSLAWRDFSIHQESRVDRRLLSTLEALSRRLARQSGVSVRAANALIGRFLYFYILSDRGLIDHRWLAQFSATEAFTCRSSQLTASLVWRVFDALDRLLNGTIFPIPKDERKGFSDADMQLLRDCIKLGDELNDAGIQLHFFDFDLSSLQTETLSAIYEKFLETEDPVSKRLEGVFYTPPYLADFVLDRVEDVTPIEVGKRVIDCTAGSGVFVVGAFRRMIERELHSMGASALPALALRDILLTSIFAIEKNASAHAVTTFSLYLTMLDYVERKDIDTCLQGRAEQPLFPPLGEENILCRDFFATHAIGGFRGQFDIAIGNPPWQKVHDVTDVTDLMADYGDRVDSDEAAEHAVWLMLEHYVRPGGIVALVMPAKSLVSPSAKRFPRGLTTAIEVLGVVNLAHLRYVLFANARQAASIVLMRNQRPSISSRTWIFSPTRAHLPGPVDQGGPWMIGFDHSQVQYFLQRDMKGEDQWFAAMMLRPVDRHIRQYIQDRMELGHVQSLRGFLGGLGMEIRKGGSPAQTGLDARVICGADKYKDNDFRKQVGVEPVRPRAQSVLVPDANPSRLPRKFAGRVNDEFLRRFSGHVLVVPRSMKELAYAREPLAFNSSLNAIFFSHMPSNSKVRAQQERVLVALGRYLESDVARYLIAITGRLWMLDRTRLEKNDLLDLPIPFAGLDDSLIDQIMDGTEAEISSALYERFGLSGPLADAVAEYGAFRSRFEDGGVPTTFSRRPNDEELKMYGSALEIALRPVSEGRPSVRVESAQDETQPYTVTIDLCEAKDAAVDFADRSGIADFSNSAAFYYDIAQTRLVLRKPPERFRWTVESAYADGSAIIQALMEETA